MKGPGFVTPALALAERELVRFFRQPSRVIGAFATPLIFWLVVGSGLGSSFRPQGGQPGYFRYLYPGIVLLIVLFTSIFSAMSLIEDRKEGFLQSVLVSPAPRAAIVFGKVAGGAAIATLQGIAFLLLAPVAGFHLNPVRFVELVLFLFVVSIGLSALGFAMAWRIDSTQGYHGVMNLLLMPMWLLSGSAFPITGASAPLAAVMRSNPLAYGASGLRQLLEASTAFSLASLPTSVAVVTGFSAVVFLVALAGARRPRP
ncbi:MAG: ABC transporter permease [Acidobacteriota bacterium]